MCSNWVSWLRLAFWCHNLNPYHCTFWYSSEAFDALGFDISCSSKSEASFSSSARGLDTPCFLAWVFFCRFALGGVDESSDASCSDAFSELEFSSSVTGFGRFFDAAGLAFGLRVDCVVFLGAGFAGAAFVVSFVKDFLRAFGAALGALNFYNTR